MLSADVQDAFRPSGLASELAIRVVSGAITSAELVAIKLEVIEIATSRQLSLGAFFDARSGQYVIHTDAKPVEFSDLLARHPESVRLLDSRVIQYSRHADSTPHRGGAEIDAAGYDACTSGFTVVSVSGYRRMVTAGHCFPLNTSVFSPGNGSSFGTVIVRATYPNWDMELLGGSTYRAQIYVGGATGDPKSVVGAADPVVGRAIYCHSGAATFEGCSETVSDLSEPFCVDGQCVPDTLVFDGPNDPFFGDSGAPFYLPGTKASIRGMVLGGGFLSCPCYAHKWSTIAWKFGVTIATE